MIAGLLEHGVPRRNTNPKKVYCIDHALIASVSSAILVNSGHLLENLVFTALRRRHPEIHYYRTRTGREVDFVVSRRGRPPLLVQACESLAGQVTDVGSAPRRPCSSFQPFNVPAVSPDTKWRCITT